MHRRYRDREREHWEAKITAHAEQPSGYGPLSTPYLAADELIVRLILHPSRRKPISLRSRLKSKRSGTIPPTPHRRHFHLRPAACLPSPLSALLSYAI